MAVFRTVVLRSCALALLACGGLLLIASPVRADEALAVPLYALVVGGGPDVESNAAQIEGHARFVASLLPPAAKRAVLFADGKTDAATVSYADTAAPAAARRALSVLLASHADSAVLTRPPRLGVPLDGPSRLHDVRRALATLLTQATKQPAPLLLYFAGHGSRDRKNESNTQYDLWNNEKLKVRDLAAELARLPRQVPTVLVMAQCFSGAFADVLFRGGDLKAELADADIVGFFSAQKDREAAGCSYATERADYQDFSSYFFGALCGRDRFGDAVAGADYDGDGAVSLHEAFCYALIHDRSADTPICTTDVFLHARAVQPDPTIYRAPFREIWQTGTPAQRAVLDELSRQLGLEGEARAVAVFDRLTYGDPAARLEVVRARNDAKEQLNALRERQLPPFFERWSALRWKNTDSGEYKKAFGGAADELVRAEPDRRALLAADRADEQADEAVDNEEAGLRRFANLYEHLVEAARLRADGKQEVRAQFEKIWKGEQSVLPLVSKSR